MRFIASGTLRLLQHSNKFPLARPILRKSPNLRPTCAQAFINTTAITVSSRIYRPSTCNLRNISDYGSFNPPQVHIALYSTSKSGSGKSGSGAGGHRGGRRHGTNNGGNDDDGWDHPFTFYIKLLDRYPLATKTATSAVITAIGDIIAQYIAGANKLDWRRVFALFIVGAALTAPLFHYVYEYLELAIPASRGWRNVVAQLCVDQLLAAPLWLAAFFPTVLLIERATLDERTLAAISAQYQRDYVPSLLLTWKIFIPMQALSFTLLPASLRVLALNIIDIVYTAALSFLTHKSHKRDITN